MQNLKEFVQQIIEAATEVHQHLGGPGLLESIYECALCHELALRGLQNRRQVPIAVTYKCKEVREPLFVDIVVEDKLIIEVKATGKDYPVYQAQLATYLRLTGVKAGLLINFGKPNMKDGIQRMVNL